MRFLEEGEERREERKENKKKEGERRNCEFRYRDPDTLHVFSQMAEGGG